MATKSPPGRDFLPGDDAGRFAGFRAGEKRIAFYSLFFGMPPTGGIFAALWGVHPIYRMQPLFDNSPVSLAALWGVHPIVRAGWAALLRW